MIRYLAFAFIITKETSPACGIVVKRRGAIQAPGYVLFCWLLACLAADFVDNLRECEHSEAWAISQPGNGYLLAPELV
jgi:hypothetical protein